MTVIGAFGLQAPQDGSDLALDFNAYGPGSFDHAAPATVGASGIDAGGYANLLALAGHLHDSQLSNGQDMAFRSIVLHFSAHAIEHLLPGPPVFHIDEIDDNQAADIA